VGEFVGLDFEQHEALQQPIVEETTPLALLFCDASEPAEETCRRLFYLPPRFPLQSFLPVIYLDFATRWQKSGCAKRANYGLFLRDLCDLLQVPKPDPTTDQPTQY
jgi:hypothetical protein